MKISEKAYMVLDNHKQPKFWTISREEEDAIINFLSTQTKYEDWGKARQAHYDVVGVTISWNQFHK